MVAPYDNMGMAYETDEKHTTKVSRLYGCFKKKIMRDYCVFSKLKKTPRMLRAMCASCRIYTISGSVRYLSLMDVFPSALCGCAHRRVYMRGSLMMGLA